MSAADLEIAYSRNTAAAFGAAFSFRQKGVAGFFLGDAAFGCKVKISQSRVGHAMFSAVPATNPQPTVICLEFL